MSNEHPFTVKSFFDFLREGKLMGVRCSSCGEIMWPPRPICKSCGKMGLEWIELRPTGTVEALTVIHVAPNKFRDEAPYPLAIVKLDDGPRVTAKITNFKLGEVSVGSPVEGDTESWMKKGLTFKPTIKKYE
ncbi:MAG: Zn-ribbon domain-containing OB-fold protein [Candidatus Bathyarchaeia archaeon]